MHIFILEDDLVQQTRLKKMVQELVTEEGLSARRLEAFSQPERLLESIEEKGDHHLFLLDINIDGNERRGLEVAAQIRDQDSQAVIIFVTTHTEFAPISFKYKVSAFDFIDKTVSDQEFKESLRQAVLYLQKISQTARQEEMFVYQSPKSRIQVPLSDILYFETSTTAHKIVLHTKTERLEFYAKLSEIVQKKPAFFQCHRSYVVNLHNVARIDKASLTLSFDNGDVCLVSRLKMKALLTAWDNK